MIIVNVYQDILTMRLIASFVLKIQSMKMILVFVLEMLNTITQHKILVLPVLNFHFLMELAALVFRDILNKEINVLIDANNFKFGLMTVVNVSLIISTIKINAKNVLLILLLMLKKIFAFVIMGNSLAHN